MNEAIFDCTGGEKTKMVGNMITTKDIYRAIKQRLSEDFPDKTAQNKDLKNPLRPCIYVEFVESNDRIVANDTVQTTCSFNIVYYSADKTFLDLTDMAKSLQKSLKKPLKVNYQYDNEDKYKFLEITDAEITMDEYEYIMECSIGFDFLQDAKVVNPYDEYQNNEIMDELGINYEKEV